MPKISYERSGINPAKISGPYSLLAVMLLVAEILFAIWFYKAQSSVERTIAGSLMAAVFITLMVLVMKLNSVPGKEKSKNSSIDLVNLYLRISLPVLLIVSTLNCFISSINRLKSSSVLIFSPFMLGISTTLFD